VNVPLGSYRLYVVANGISSNSVTVAVTHKVWKELKWEIKEVKEHLKIETDGVKLVFEDLRKINEGDERINFGDLGWGEVIRQLVNRSDQVEGQLRTFIKKDERPETGIIPIPMSVNPSEPPPKKEHRDEDRKKNTDKPKKKK